MASVESYAHTLTAQVRRDAKEPTPHGDAAPRHGTAGDPVHGPDGHSANDRREREPVPPALNGRDAQVDLRGSARDKRAGK